ncbi:MAG: helix-turn-helix transcriptional regulator [Symploca sp. SIO2E9]|nr:helix-turn-helix transcriptional regulator [Symploca sp. SIO2E9]
MTSFGDKIKQRRESLNFTQRQLALELDVTVTTVQNWEYGRHIPKLAPKQMKQLCDLLNFTLEELAE